LLRLGDIDGTPEMHLYSKRSRYLSGKNYCLSPLSNPGGLFKIGGDHFQLILSRNDEGNKRKVNVDGKIIRKREIDRFKRGE
jgi:hypothetical protein